MKDFNKWNKEKKDLEMKERDTLWFHEREIWWCSIGLNLGDEQDGKNEMFERPVLIVKKFNKKICWILPMTTKNKSGTYYHQILYEGKVFSIVLSQIRLVSIKRFRRFIRKISPYQFKIIQKKIVNFLI